MRKVIYILFVIPLGVLLIALALANRHTVRLVFDPISPDAPLLSLEAPLFIVLLASLIIGLVLGGFLTWLKQGRWRRAARQRAREAEALRVENDRLARQLEAASRPRLPETAASE